MHHPYRNTCGLVGMAVGALMTCVTGASARSFEDDPFSLWRYRLENGDGYRESYYRDRHWSDEGWRRRGAMGGVCEPADALRQARRAGLRLAGVRDVSPNYVVVKGQRYGREYEIVLFNSSGCPYAPM